MIDTTDAKTAPAILPVKSYADRVMRVHALVNTRSDLNANEKANLHSHLLMNIDEFTIDLTPTSQREDVGMDRNSTDDFIIDKNDGVILCHLMSELDKTLPSSVEEKEIVAQLMATFVPRIVEKPTRLQQQHSEISDDHQPSHNRSSSTSSTTSESDVKNDDEVDEIEFPFTPPTKRENSPEYHAAKEMAITQLIEANTLLTTTQKQSLVNLLLRFHDRFSIKGENMERTDSVQHEIDTKDRHPFRERLRQYSPAINEIISNEVDQMIKQGVVVPSRSPYASNLLLVRKPDPSSEGGVKNRVCASFVRLNTDTEKDSYPLPNIQYIFDKIGKSKWFTTMDLLSGFWQVMIKPEHRYKTAFITVRGLYEFVVMPFGLCNAPATFQRLMDAVILPEYRDFIETYIDDLMTHSSSFEDHLRHLETLLTALKKHKLVVKLSKCKFAQQEVKFLGHVISQNKIKTNPEAVEAIKKWEKPAGGGKKAITAVRGFLGMAGWYRKFIPNFAHIAKPLVHLTKNDVEWEWTKECQSAFEQLRDALTISPVLAIADPKKNYILHTDASDHAMGAILQQEDENGDKHPIAYASKTFNDAQKRYDTTEREALAIVWALQHFNTYCEGHEYTIITDHQALSYIKSNSKNDKRITRWQLLLQHYNIKDIKYMPGSQNHAADLLSRPSMDLKEHQTIHVNAITRNRKPKKDDREYEIQQIVDKREIAGKTDECSYRVRWKGCTEAEDTWMTIDRLTNARQLIIEYEQRQAAIRAEELSFKLQSNSTEKEEIRCDECEEQFMNHAALHMHRFHEHDIQVPTHLLSRMSITDDVDSFISLQKGDPQFRCIYNTEFGHDEHIKLNKYEKKTIRNNEFLLDSQGLLYQYDVNSSRSRLRVHTQLRLCIPATERQRVMHEQHKIAHHGVIHMYDTLRETMWWPSMLKDVYKYVSTCQECQVNKNEKYNSSVQPMTIPSRPWSHIAIDHVGPFPMSNGGYKYILVIVDRLTRYAEAFPVTDTSAKVSADIIVKHIICRYGMPDVILSDRGSGFMSEIFRGIMQLMGIKQTKTTAHHPQSNGLVERFNKTLKKMIKIWVNSQHSDWDVLLPFVLFAYNTSVHSILKETPYYLNFARQAKTTISDMTDSFDMRRVTVHAYAHEVADKLKRVHDQVRDILARINDDRTNQINESEWLPLKVGDLVFLHQPNTPMNRSKKFIKRWIGPYNIIKVYDNNTFDLLRDGTTMKVSGDRLRLVKADRDTMEQQHEHDLALATAEIDMMNDQLVKLTARRDQLSSLADISRLGLKLEREGDTSANDTSSSHIDNDAHDDDEDERKYDEDDDVTMNTMYFVPMIHYL